MRFDPTLGVRLFLSRKDVTARFVGEALSISACKQVIPEHIFWNRTINGTCYEFIPVTVQNHTFFIQEGTQELTRHSATIPCNEVPTSIYKDSDGLWKSPAGLAQVSDLQRRISFKSKHNSFKLRAPSIFNSDMASVVTTFAVLSNYANRINRLEKEVLHLTIPEDSYFF